jgi:hypothetical protein
MTSPVIQADSILHPERIVGNPQPWDFFRFAPDTSEMAQSNGMELPPRVNPKLGNGPIGGLISRGFAFEFWNQEQRRETSRK